MDEVIFVLLQNEVLRQKNRVSSLGSDSALVVTRDRDGKGQSDKGHKICNPGLSRGPLIGSDAIGVMS